MKKLFFLFLVAMINGIFFANTVKLYAKQNVQGEIVIDNTNGKIEDRIRIINNTDSNVDVVITGQHKRKGIVNVTGGLVKAADTKFLFSEYNDDLDDFWSFTVSLKDGVILSFSAECTRDDLYFAINKVGESKNSIKKPSNKDAEGEIVVDNSNGKIEDRIRIINNTDSNVEVIVMGQHKRKGKMHVAAGFVKASDTEFLFSEYNDDLDDFRSFTISLKEGRILSFSTKFTRDDLYFSINKTDLTKSPKISLSGKTVQNASPLVIKVFCDEKNYSQLKEKDKNLFHTAYLRCLQNMTIIPEISIRSNEIDKNLREIQKTSQIEATMGLASETATYAGDKGSRADLAMNITLNKIEGDLYQIVFTVSEIEKMNLISAQMSEKLPLVQLTDNKVIDELSYRLLLDLQKRNYIDSITDDVTDLLVH